MEKEEEVRSSMADLPDDIVYDILLRLPAKSLSRFKCASRSWSSLISSDGFHHDHFRRSETTPLFLTMRTSTDDLERLRCQASYYNPYFMLHLSTYTTTTLRPYFINQSKYCTSGGFSGSTDKHIPFLSCRGLLFIAFPTFSPFICNPSTQELTRLPKHHPESGTYGFGYAASTLEFKVVLFYGRERYSVFSLGSRAWRAERRTPFLVRSRVAPFVNGYIHLLNFFHSDQIAAFNIDTEEIIVIQGPWSCPWTTPSQLTELGGLLCMTVRLEMQWDIWLLKDYSNVDWVKEYIIDMSNVEIPMVRGLTPVGIVDDGSILIKMSGELWCYDVASKRLTRRVGNEKQLYATFYVESLFSLPRRRYAKFCSSSPT